MSDKFFQVMKNQIDKQTRDRLNVNLETNLAPIKKEDKKVESIEVPPLTPVWTKGYYNFNRYNNLMLSPKEFLNYSGVIRWERINSLSVNVNNIAAYDNILYGVQLFANKAVRIPFVFNQSNCSFSVWIKPEGNTDYSMVYNNSAQSSFSAAFFVLLPAFTWVNLVIIIYSNNSNSFMDFQGVFKNVSSTRVLDMDPPIAPTWATIPIVRTQYDEQNGKTKLTLQWNKDSEFNFSGNGIYRFGNIDSGLIVDKVFPTLIYESNRVNSFISFGNGTINSGDTIKFSSNGSEFTVTSVIKERKNLIQSPMFNSSDDWSFTTGTLKQDETNKYTDKYYSLDTLMLNSKVTLTSATFSISPTITKNYKLNITTNNDLLSCYDFGLGGFSTPQNWVSSGSMSVTGSSFISGVIVTRTGPATFRTSDSSIYFSNQHQYYVTSFASLQKPGNYHLTFCKNSGAPIWTSSTITVTDFGNFKQMSTLASCSGTGWGYFAFMFPDVGSTINNFATIYLRTPNVHCLYQEDRKEYFRVDYFSGVTPCATANSKFYLNDQVSSVTYSYTYKSQDILGSVMFALPSGCNSVKVSYIASVNSSPFYIYRRIDFMSWTDELQEFTNAVYATNSMVISVTPTHYFTLGSTVYLNQLVHRFDRPRQGTDGAIISWDDFEIENNTVYTYYLDAYDNSEFSNKSAMSVPASIDSGDYIAPLPPTNYSLSRTNGGVIHSWTNATASDISFIRCYSDSTLTSVLFEQPVTSSTDSSYSEFTTSTALLQRYLISGDTYGNTSSSVTATCTPLSSGEPNLPFNIIMKDKVTGSIFAGGWTKNSNIIASIVTFDSYQVGSIFRRIYNLDTRAYVPTNLWYSYANGTWGMCSVIGRLRIEGYVRTTDGNNTEVKSTECYYDPYTPTFQNQNYLWKRESQGYPGYNLLLFDPSRIKDIHTTLSFDGAGVKEVHIMRSMITNGLTSNPNFEANSPGTLLSGWSSGTFQIIATSNYYNGEQVVQLTCSNSAAIVTVNLNSDSFHLATSDQLVSYARYMGILTASATQYFGLYLKQSSNNAVLASIKNNAFTSSTLWRYIALATTSKLGTMCYIQAKYSKLGAASGAYGYCYLDEVLAFKNQTFATVAVVKNSIEPYFDYNVTPWGHYIYHLRVFDNVGNMSGRSYYKYCRPTKDYRDSYRNMLNNSSFEKGDYTASGTLRAKNWVPYYYSNGATTQITQSSGDQTALYTGGATHGNYYVLSGKSDGSKLGDIIFQNDITILPYNGRERNFLLSVFACKYSATTAAPRLYIFGYNDDHYYHDYKQQDITTLATIGKWVRVLATYKVSVPSITNISVGLGNTGAANMVMYDAAMLEEKDSTVPGGYYDGEAVIAEYIQGNLIRGHMIEADAIRAQHIRANSIIATHIHTDTIESTHFKLNNKNIYIVNKEPINIELFSTEGYNYYYPNFTAGTMALDGSGGARFHFTCIKRFASGTPQLVYGNIGHTFNNTSKDLSYFYVISTIYNDGYPLVCSKYPDGSATKSLFIIGYDGNTGYSTYATVVFDSSPSGFSFKNLVSCATNIENNEGSLRYYNNSYYFLTRKLTMDATLLFYKYSIVGTVKSQSYISVVPQATIQAFDFDFTENGTILISFCQLNSPTLYFMNVSTLWSTISTLKMDTYNGYSNTSEVDNEVQYGVSWCGIARVTQNQFVSAYRLTDNSYTYYKILNSLGSIFVGNDADVPLTDNRVHPNGNQGQSQIRPRIMRSYSNNILFYIPANSVAQLTNLMGETLPLGGKAVFMHKVSSTLNIVDLFNRMS